jgi:hypothetical protein
MFSKLVELVRADVDRQIGWGKTELRRQGRYAAITAALAVGAALSALGAIAVGCIALYSWLEMRYGAFVALAILGGGFALLAFLLLDVFVRHRPKVRRPPALQSVRPAMLITPSSRRAIAKPSRPARKYRGLRTTTCATDHGSLCSEPWPWRC